MTLIGNSLPLPYLRRRELINGCPAKAEIVRTVGGNVRFLAEWTTGKTFGWGSTTETTPPCAPLTGNVPHESSGEAIGPGPGHDHSGGVMGAPILRNVWMSVYGDVDASITAQTFLATTLNTSQPNVDLCNTKISALWVPWSMRDGAYSSLYWMAYLHNDTAACNYAVEIQNNNTGDRIYEEGSLTTGYQRLTLAREIVCQPGHFNHFFCKVNVSRDGADTTVTLNSWGLFQKKTDP